MDTGEPTNPQILDVGQIDLSSLDYNQIETQIRADTSKWKANIPASVVQSGFLKQCYGTVELLYGKFWLIKGEPHFLTRLKNVFKGSASHNIGFVLLTNKRDTCKDLAWVLSRYKVYFINPSDMLVLHAMSQAHDEMIIRLEKILAEDYVPRQIQLAKPPRPYQASAANIILDQGYLLVGDEVGLGKTVTSICTFTDKRTLPAAVITLSGTMPKQWQDEIKEFAPDLHVHVAKKAKAYELPKKKNRSPDVVVMNYHKLEGWAEMLGQYCKSVIFDEVQELRRTESAKYFAAEHLAKRVDFRAGLSATPIYNYGGEIFNIMEILCPGKLGTKEEFVREWCHGSVGPKYSLEDAPGFGTFMREQFMMVRRTRKDVGRELPGLTKIPYLIECDEKELRRIEGEAVELASVILQQTDDWKGQRMNAGGQLDNLVRQATGIAKAPFIAAFLKMLIEDGQRVLCSLWHRQVYEIVLELMARDDIPVCMFTGSESPAKKAKEKQRFLDGESPLMLISNRAGAGLDGLQKVCSTVVVGELDWSPGVHEQIVGRIYRDGQLFPVNAWFLHTHDGSDPLMMEVLGIKKEQVDGIREPEKDFVEKLEVSGKEMRELALRILQRQRKR